MPPFSRTTSPQSISVEATPRPPTRTVECENPAGIVVTEPSTPQAANLGAPWPPRSLLGTSNELAMKLPNGLVTTQRGVEEALLVSPDCGWLAGNMATTAAP